MVRRSTTGIRALIGGSGFFPNVGMDNVLVTNRWYRIALVGGSGGMRLFLNGTHRINSYTGSFAGLRITKPIYWGRWVGRRADDQISKRT
jgi:hypothetical protein